MSTVNFSVPASIKARFNEVFAHENKSQIITELMKQAIREYECKQERALAINALLKIRAKQKPRSQKSIEAARKKNRA